MSGSKEVITSQIME
jgi:isopenicillin N synthase-like dioxygenase